MDAANANLKTPDGQDLDHRLTEDFPASKAAALATCIESLDNPDLTTFEMLINLTAAGAAREILVMPETNVALCYRAALLDQTFPRPPTDSYWAYVRMTLQS